MNPDEKKQFEEMKTQLGQMKQANDSLSKIIGALSFNIRQIFPTASGYYSGQSSNFMMRMPNLTTAPSGPSIGQAISIIGGILKRWTGSAWSNVGSSNFSVHWALEYQKPQAANNFYGNIWIAPMACRVVSIREVHKDSAAGALTLTVYKSGTSLLSSGFDLLNVGGDVVTTGSLSATAGVLDFAIGDRLHWGVSGSVGSIQGVCITVEFQPL